jgi:hypothetical protein
MILRHNGSYHFEPVGTGEGAFEEHKLAMRSFRQSHQPFGTGINYRETGGTYIIITAGWTWLPYRTAPERFSGN